MAAFSEQERAYLAGQRLGRLATVDDQGRPHVVPVGFTLEPDGQAIGIGGRNFAASRKFRDASGHPEVAIVVDDLVSVQPWVARGIEILGRAEARTDAAGQPGVTGSGDAWLRITPDRIISWGLDGGS